MVTKTREPGRAKLSRNLKEDAEVAQNLSRSAGMSRRTSNGDGENHESTKGLHWYGGGRKSMKEEKIKAVI